MSMSISTRQARKYQVLRQIYEIQSRHAARVAGKRGAPQRRAVVAAVADRIRRAVSPPAGSWPADLPILRRESRRRAWIARSAQRLAAAAGLAEVGRSWDAGRITAVDGRDYMRAADVIAAGLGVGELAIVSVTRTRTYAPSCRWRPSERRQTYLVGVSPETGATWAHAVPASCQSIRTAWRWIWRCGDPRDVVAYQGDVAVIRRRGQHDTLPERHELAGDQIIHPSHAPIAAPLRGERITVGRRAADTMRMQCGD